MKVRKKAEARRAGAAHPGQQVVRGRGNGSQYVAKRRAQRRRGRLEVVGQGCEIGGHCRRGRPTRRQASRPRPSAGPGPEHAAGRQRKARVDQCEPALRQVRCRKQPLTDALHAVRPAGEAHQHVRPQLHCEIRVRGDAPQAPEQSQAGRRVGRSAADTGRDRQILVERQSGLRRSPGAGGHRAGSAQHEVVRLILQRGRERAGQRQTERVGRFGAQDVAHVGEHRQAVELVVAVRPPAGHVQVEIDLGRRELRQHQDATTFYWTERSAEGEPSAAVPVSSRSLASSLAASSGSGFRVSARRHW